MSGMSKIVPCVDCQEMFPRKLLNREFRCQDCRFKILRDNILQLMAHEGPHYEKWKQACLRKAERYAEGIKGGK